ncbi:MAG: TatD family hydrolase [Anaerolineae bacterium]|nr:TatD family hydrolase [Anaerolineae bacterium]
MLIDTHCHLNFDGYDADREAVLRRAADAGVTRIIIPSVDLVTGQEGIDLAERYAGVFAAAGLHPNSTANFTDADLEAITAQAAHAKVVAIGEIGLDYHWDDSPKALQHRAFEAQLALAAKLELPVIIHNREASDDVLPILEAWAATLPPALKERPGVLHSFSAPPSIAERALAINFYLGFTGPVTYKNAEELRRVALAAPLDRMLVETDGPYLTPVPHRGKRNEPAYVALVADRIAALKGLTLDEFAAATTANAERLFRLPGQPSN